MRKKLKKVMLMMMIGAVVFTTGCGSKGQEIETVTEEVTTIEETTAEVTTEETTTEEASTEPETEDEKAQEALENSSYPALEEIEGVRWERDAEQDSESLCFAEDNYFSYGCDCGNPVGDADLYTEYSYDQGTGVFTMPGEQGDIYVKIVEYNGDSIVLEMPKELVEGEKIFTRTEGEEY